MSALFATLWREGVPPSIAPQGAFPADALCKPRLEPRFFLSDTRCACRGRRALAGAVEGGTPSLQRTRRLRQTGLASRSLVQRHALVGDACFHEDASFRAETGLAVELDCVGLRFQEYLGAVALAGCRDGGV